ncbi:hypothetical protein Ocin01_15365 [Orchesella cincta]|uniref:Uncharacterized protein n=1 Tax=Orchesella cincta TaxID=48709 RepID=A0A1D2ME72_ORCCI|nr:hypothetical protein Ocin01_15365 [Orchesella cincta]
MKAKFIATNCVINFRDILSIPQEFACDDDDTDAHEQIFLFYSSTLSSPPRIRPGNFFTLGRHNLPLRNFKAMRLLRFKHRKINIISDPIIATKSKEDVRSLLIVPIRINQLLGTFPLSLHKSELALEKSWLSNFFGKTEQVTQLAISSLINLIENVCLVLFLLNRSQIQKFYSEFLKSFVGLLETCYKLSKHQEFNLPLRTSRLHKILGVIFILGLINLGSTWVSCITKSIEVNLGFKKLTTFLIISSYWSLMHYFRLLICYFWICTIMCFQLSFKAVAILAEGHHNDDEHNHNEPRSSIILWVMESFEKLEEFLQEFHSLFGVQLLSMCIIILLPILNCCFELISSVKAEQLGVWEQFTTLVGVVPHLVALVVTFFILCDVSTGMVDEAKGCVTDFRSIRSIDLNGDIQEKARIRLFYISTLSNPPSISPGRFFNLGRHIIPPPHACPGPTSHSPEQQQELVGSQRSAVRQPSPANRQAWPYRNMIKYQNMF